MAWLKETLSVCGWNFRMAAARFQSSLIAIVGFLGVVLVVVALLSIRAGFQSVLSHTGSDSVAIVTYQGAGSLSRQAVTVIGQAPGVAHGPNGPLAMGDYTASARAVQRGTGRYRAAVGMRGVGSDAAAIWPHWHIIKGRLFKPGLDEIVVGRQAAQMFKGLGLGDTYDWNGHHWKVVGIFADNGGIHESEIWTDVNQLRAAYNAGDQYSGVYVRLTSADAFPGFKQAVEHDPQLSVSVVRESTFFRESGKELEGFIAEAGGVIGLLMAIGAIFAALNVLYANIAGRIRDIATLRALGFARGAVVVAVLAEGVMLGLIGGGAGALIAWLAFDGLQTHTRANGSVMAFNFAVTPTLIGIGIAAAIVMGLVGGLFPAIRAARLPVAQALRET
ncbi:MAG TPA: ABC transporter permease [Gammaproteobacteria bacterium]|nr:ABC transporter permease [Gammaproteobacteria bacterium]